MLKRELLRVVLLGIVGVFVALYLYYTKEYTVSNLYIVPLYVIGMVYAGKYLVKMILSWSRTYLSSQMTSLVVNPLWGSIICIIVFLVGLYLIIHYGWILGIVRCLYQLGSAFMMDMDIRNAQNGEGY